MNLSVSKLLILGFVFVQLRQGNSEEVSSLSRRHVSCQQALKRLETKLDSKLNAIKANIDSLLLEKNNLCKAAKNCVDILKCGGKTSGVYTVKPFSRFDAFKVYCDQTTAGGGWAVFQRRRDGSVDFYRGWSTYKHGFGHVMGEFWLGLDKINLLTHQTRNKLRVDMMDWHGNTKFAEYSYFSVAAERSKYVLGLGRYSGTAGDSLSYHRGSPFSTKGRDNDAYGRNCAADYKGAWWFKSCYNSHLNGEYRTSGDAVAWNAFSISLKRSEMKIRPTDFIPK